MISSARAITVALALMLPSHAVVGPAVAQGVDAAGSPTAGLPQVAIDAPIVTSHRGVFGGKTINYDAIVEPFVTRNLAGTPAAKLVATSYIAKAGQPHRPVVFVFNGGPITAATPLHMGMFGPKRLAAPDDVEADPATFELVDNAYSPLDVVDVVIFDPASTGYSRVLPGVPVASQFSTAEDSRQLAELVRLWIDRHKRQGSPIYFVGESYGTLRAPEAAYQLRNSETPVSGIVLLGQALNIVEYSQRRDNVVSYAVSLPTLAATGFWYGKAERRGRDFASFMKEAEEFGNGQYLSVLFLGNRATSAQKEDTARKLQEFTGLPAEVFLKADLKVPKTQYQQQLLPGFVLDTNDTRYKRPVAGKGGGGFPRYGVVAQQYYHDFLRVPESAGTYSTAIPTAGRLNAWDWDVEKSPFSDWPWVRQVREMLTANPEFRVLVGNGYYDTQTTVGAMDLLVAQSGWPAKQVRSRRFEGGHMMYTVEATAKAVGEEIRGMMQRRW